MVGDTLSTFVPTDNHPPPSGFATPDVRNGHPVLDFDASLDEATIFTSIMPRLYAGGSIACDIVWMASTATSGNVIWDVAFERIIPGTTDLDADDFAAAVVSATAVVNATNGVTTKTSVTLTQSQADAVAAGDSYRIRVRRLGLGSASDTMLGDAELVSIELREV